jgi:hypothetical protein
MKKGSQKNQTEWRRRATGKYTSPIELVQTRIIGDSLHNNKSKLSRIIRIYDIKQGKIKGRLIV